MKALELQEQILLAKYRPHAITQLVVLCNNANNEVSRKACLDMLNCVISRQKSAEQALPTLPELKPETASRLLAVLAEERDTNRYEDVEQ
jgi:hypothetical protein